MKKLSALLVFLLLSSCSSMHSNEEEVKAKRVSEINIQLGMAYLGNGNTQRAKEKLLYALQKTPKLPEAWYSMAYFQEMTGNKKEADEYYLKAMALAPGRGDVENNYGTFNCRLGRYDEAIKHFLLAVKDKKYLDMSSAYENAGLCALKIPDRRLAKQFFEKALEEDPTRITSTSELAKLQSFTSSPMKSIS